MAASSQLCTVRPHVNAVPMALFPTMGSLQEVLDYSESRLPITSKNELHSLLMMYHNTLLKTVQQQ